jgi:outer membrane protein assembly factor BamB
MLWAVLLVGVLASFPAASRSSTPTRKQPAARWLAYGHDGQLTNFVRIPGLTSKTARLLKLKWSKTLDGAIVASPLYAKGTLYVETEAGSVYALRPSDGAIRWRRTLGIVSTQSCGNWGLTSTGAIDLARNVLYAISSDGLLHALSLTSGSERPGWPLGITNAHADGEYVWGGLRLLGSTLYIPVASYCDVAGSDGHVADGRLVAVDVRRPQVTAIFDPVPGDGNLGGIWGWGGVSVAADGKTLYTGVGNSRVYDPSCSCYEDTAGLGDSMVKLTPNLHVVGWYRSKQYPGTGDYDFGSSPLLFRPAGCKPFAAANSKLGWMYIWNRDRLSHGPKISFGGLGDGIAAFVGQPSYAPALRMVYESHVFKTRGGKKIGDGIQAFSVDTGCRFHRRWLTSVGEGQMPPPLVVGDVVFAAGGETGAYTALDARTGKRLWHFATASATLAPAIAAESRIFAGDFGGTLRAFAPR